jgi:DNA-binding MarR family transcriptional regulator
MSETNTGRLLINAFRTFESRLLERLNDAGYDEATPGHLAALRHLDPEGLQISRLAEDAGVSRQAMSEMVRELMTRGWVKKERDPDDGRAKLITYTDEGHELIAEAQEAVAEIEDELVEMLGEKAYGELRSALQAMTVRL